jgi:hypothetical protein
MANILYRGSAVPSAVNSSGGKNAALTNLEIDQNFYALNRDKFETAGGTVSGATTFSSNVTITGNLTVDGTTTTVNSTTITIDDINIELGSIASPTNATANGGGITLKGASDKTFNWYSATSAWTSSEHLSLAAGKNILLNGSSSGTITLAVPAAAGGNTITFQAATGTVAHLADIGNGTVTVTAGSALTGSGSFTMNQDGNTTVTLSHADTSSVADITTGTNEFIKGETYDTYGHVQSRTTGFVDFTTNENWAFQKISISTNSGYTWGAANANNIQAAESSSDTLTLVNGGGINIYGSTNVTTDAILIEHADTSSVSNLSSDNSGNTFIQDISFTFDTYGHVTAASVATGTVPSPTLDSVTSTGFTTRGSQGTIANAGQESPGLEIYGGGSTNAAFMTFHRPGAYAIKLGLDTDNVMKIGGWSAGSVAWPIWHTGNLTNLNQLTNGPGYISGLSFDGLSSKDGGTGYYQTSGSFRAPIFYDSNDTGYYCDPNGYSKMANIEGTTQVTSPYVYGTSVRTGTNFYVDQACGYGIVGLYNSNRYQGVFAMGSSYVLAADGTGPGQLYGIAWAYPGDRGGPTANLASHGMLILQNGVFKGAWGGGSLRTPGDVRAPVYYDYDDTTYYADLNGTTYGYFLRSATSVQADSDRRIKDNIQTIENGLDKVLRLRGTTFTRNDLEDKNKKYIGLIAQEVLEVLPEVVSGSEDTKYSVGYGEIVSVLIEAIKELNAKVEDLQNQLANK